jgi:hypothetical protein
MNVLSKFDFETYKFLDIQAGEYNIGVVPNILIDKMIHEISFINVKHQIIGRYKHRQLWKDVMADLDYNIDLPIF